MTDPDFLKFAIDEKRRKLELAPMGEVNRIQAEINELLRLLAEYIVTDQTTTQPEEKNGSQHYINQCGTFAHQHQEGRTGG